MVRVNIVLTRDIIEQLDDVAREEGKNRSEILREAALTRIEEHRRLVEEMKRQERVRRAVETQDRLREKGGDWDGLAEIRKWRNGKR